MNATTIDRTVQDKVIAWIEAHVGGTVERCEKQSRWRGGWWVDVRRDGALIPLYVREERQEDFPPWPLEHEARLLTALERHGIPAPHVWGVIDDPHAMVMDAMPGSTSFAQYGDDEAAKLSVLTDFAEAMARMHAIPPEEVAGPDLPMPKTPEEISLGCFALCEDIYLKGKRRPDPRIEFLRRWVRRNIPRHRTKVSLLAVDSAQFLHAGGKVTSLFDLEYGCLGDPLIDLASVPGRMMMEGIEDTRAFYRRYAEVSGDTLDPSVITFHRAWWGLCTPLIVAPNFDEPPEAATYFEYACWYVSPLMGVMLAIANYLGITLEKSFDPGPPRPSRWGRMIEVMAARIPPASADEPYALTEQRKFLEFMRRADAHRDFESGYFAQVEALVGRQVTDWRDADAALEAFVIDAGPEHDEALLRLIFGWTVAQAVTLLDGPGYNLVSYLHRPMPDFADLVN